MNPLDDYPVVRRILYFVQWVLNGASGAAGVYFAAAEATVPKWFVLTVAILSFVWAYTGITAQGNVTQKIERHRRLRTELGAVDLTLVIVLVILILLVFLLIGAVHIQVR